MDAEAGAGVLVDALLAEEPGALPPPTMLGSPASGAAAALLNSSALPLQLVQGDEAEVRVLAPGVVLTSIGAPPPASGMPGALCLHKAKL